ncbi:MAG: glycosyltransferase family 4 protein [Gemmatimonadaceae bacterium]
MSTFTLLTQTYPPDPAAVGQHMADLAAGLVQRGHTVNVITSARGYDDPSRIYPASEMRDGVAVHRLGGSSFGKKSLAHRIAGVAGFAAQSSWMVLTRTSPDALIFSTSPPLIGVVARMLGWLGRTPTAFWAMDLNPDQLIALGMIRPNGASARTLEALNRFALAGPELVIALDRFMERRLAVRNVVRGRLVVVPPWAPPELSGETGSGSHVLQEDVAGSGFRREHGLADKFVVMYSGNHSPSNPLSTVLQAAAQLRDDDRIRFLFVGGGVGKREVDEFRERHQLRNVLSLPYQPKESLHESLAAADVHVVSLGDAMVGIIHPCKVYGAMAVGRPIFFLGPAESHVGDLLDGADIGVRVAHGDVDAAVLGIRRLAHLSAGDRAVMGAHAHAMVQGTLSTAAGVARIGELLEDLVTARPARIS